MPTRWALDRIASSLFRRAGVAQWADPLTLALALGFQLELAVMLGATLVGRKISYNASFDAYQAHAHVLTEIARAELVARKLPSDDATAIQLAARIAVSGARRMTLRTIAGGASPADEAPELLSAAPRLPS